MFGARFFGRRFFGPRYWGTGAAAVVEIPDPMIVPAEAYVLATPVVDAVFGAQRAEAFSLSVPQLDAVGLN